MLFERGREGAPTMTQTTAVLHAGLLARKGEARPAAIGSLDAFAPAAPGKETIIDIDQSMRRQPNDGIVAELGNSSRVIELPRPKIVVHREEIVKNRKQIQARVSPETHVLLKRNAARLNRTQQDLVASAIEAYLSFVGDDVLAYRCGGQDVGD
jgi:hypothetical protein